MTDSVAARIRAVDPRGSTSDGTPWNADVPETVEGALIECVKALGGSKQVGPMLWPEKDPVDSASLLRACLNHNRAERLTPDQVVLLARLARKRGCHAYMRWLANNLSYAEPAPVEPRDEADDLRRQVLEMGRTLQATLARLDRIQS